MEVTTCLCESGGFQVMAASLYKLGIAFFLPDIQSRAALDGDIPQVGAFDLEGVLEPIHGESRV